MKSNKLSNRLAQHDITQESHFFQQQVPNHCFLFYQIVRLVFRPYTQVRRSICTSEPHTSLHQSFPWLHPTQAQFTIFRVPTCMLTLRPFSRRIVAGGQCPRRSYHCYFHYAWGFATPILAHMLDSLVRVSRRGKENHFASITSTSDYPRSNPEQNKVVFSSKRTYLPQSHFSRVKPMLAHTKPQRSCRKQQEKNGIE